MNGDPEKRDDRRQTTDRTTVDPRPASGRAAAAKELANGGARTRERAATSSSIRRAPRWVRLTATCLGGAALVYLLSVNIALRLGAVQVAFASTETIKVDFAGAWSVWPGRVHVTDAVVRMQDRNVQFVLRVARVEVTIALRDLLRRTFHATRVRGDGVSFRFRHRIGPESAHAPFVAALPELEGFADPPLFESGPPEAPLSEADYDLWTVHLEDVDVELRELWTQMVRYEGKAQARGAFWLRPAKRLWVGPAKLTLQKGALSSGAHALLRDVEGELACTVHAFDVEPAHGMDVLRFVSAELAMSSHVDDLAQTTFWAGELAPWSIEQGAGTFTARGALRDGVLVPDGEARYRTEHARVTHQPSGAALDAEVDATVRGPSLDGKAHLDVALERVAVGRGDAGVTPLDVQGLAGWAAMTSVDATQSWGVAAAGFAVGDVRVRDLATSASWLPRAGVRLTSGEAHAGANAERDARGNWTGSLSLEAAHVQATQGDAYLRGDAQLAGLFRTSAGGARDASFDIDVPLIAARAGDLHASTTARITARYLAPLAGQVTWRGDLTLGKSRLYQSAHEVVTPAASCPLAVVDDGQVHGALELPTGGSARAQLGGKLNGVHFTWGDLTASVNNLELDARAEPSSAVELVATRLAARGISLKNAGGSPGSWNAEAKALEVAGHLDGADGELRGPVRVRVTGAQGHVGSTTLAGDVDAALRLAARGDAAALRLAGDVRARNVVVATGTREVRNWWANLRVSQAEVQLADGLDLHGSVQGSLQNALPVLHMLTSTDDLPAWMPAALPLENLSIVLDLERYCRLTDVRVRDAKGGPLSARGRLQLEPGETRGAVLVTLPAVLPLSVGFDFVDDMANTSTLVGESWLADHTRPMDKALADKHAAACPPARRTCQ